MCNRLHKYSLVLLACSWAHLAYAQSPAPAKQATESAALLLGTWTVSTSSYESTHRVSKTTTTKKSVSVHCNVCPEITFKANGTGYVTTEGGDEALSHFRWHVSHGTLLLTNDKAAGKATATLADGSYNIVPLTGIQGGPAVDLVDKRNTRQLLVKLGSSDEVPVEGGWRNANGTAIFYRTLAFSDLSAVFTSAGDTIYRFHYALDYPTRTLWLRDAFNKRRSARILKADRDSLVVDQLWDLSTPQRFYRSQVNNPR